MLPDLGWVKSAGTDSAGKANPKSTLEKASFWGKKSNSSESPSFKKAVAISPFSSESELKQRDSLQQRPHMNGDSPVR